MIQSKIQVRNNVINGLEYGYPECCIFYFHQRQFNGDLIEEMQENALRFQEGKPPMSSERKLNGTGYIPCPCCEEKLTEDEMTAGIAKRRLRVQPFPLQDEEWIDGQKASKLDAGYVNALIDRVIDDLAGYEGGEDLEDWPWNTAAWPPQYAPTRFAGQDYSHLKNPEWWDEEKEREKNIWND